MPTVNTFTDYTAEAADIDRRRKLAELLQQQALEPIKQETQGGYVVPISWTQGLAKMLQGGVGAYKEGKLKEESKALAARRNQALAEALGAMPTAQTSELPGSQVDTAILGMKPQTQTIQPTSRDYGTWLGRLASIGPDATAIGSTLAAHQMKQSDPYLLPEGAQRRGPNGELIAENPKDFKPDRVPPMFKDIGIGNDMVQEHVSLDGGKTWNKVPGSAPTHKFARNPDTIVNSPPPMTPVTIADPKDPNKTIVVDGRTGRMIGAGPKATDLGKLENNRAFGMQGLGGTIAEAEKILTGGTGNLPTGSTVGNIVDTVGGVFGMSPSGAKEADQLKALGGALTSKMPRMQGPQSDKDVLLYKEMAGRVGDPTIPRDRRIAALDVVKQLWSKYETSQAPQGGATGGWGIRPIP